MKPEQLLQINFAQWLDAKGVLYNASMAGVNLRPMVARQRKMMGAKAGFPDIFIYESTNEFCGLAIELKVNTRPTTLQLEWQAELTARGYKALIMPKLKTFQECFDWLKKEVSEYMGWE